MKNTDERYSDFSEDSAMKSAFSGGIGDLGVQAEQLRVHLEYENPITRITGLLGHHAIVTTGFNMAIKALLKMVVFLLGVIAVLLGYIAFQLT